MDKEDLFIEWRDKDPIIKHAAMATPCEVAKSAWNAGWDASVKANKHPDLTYLTDGGAPESMEGYKMAQEIYGNAQPTQNPVCQHYNMTVGGMCNDCGHILTEEERESYND